MFLFCQPYLLLELTSSTLLAETGSKCPLVFSVNPVGTDLLGLGKVSLMVVVLLDKDV